VDRTRLWTLVLSGALVWPAMPANAQEELVAGQCVKVHDGDTIDVLTDQGIATVHLADVDAPEPDQRFALEAKLHLVEHALAKEVTVQPVAVVAEAGEPVAAVTVADQDLARSLLRAGLAWCTQEPAPSDELLTLESAARAARKGLWADANPIAPWDWRKGVRKAAAPTPKPRTLADTARSASLATEDGGPLVIDDSQVTRADPTPSAGARQTATPGLQAVRPTKGRFDCCCAHSSGELTFYRWVPKLDCAQWASDGKRIGNEQALVQGCVADARCE
jgi:micrococcal nuclease